MRRLAIDVKRLWREAWLDADLHYCGFEHLLAKSRECGLDELHGLRVLDIGCGDRAPMSLLLAAAGASVDGVDILPVCIGRRRPLMLLRLPRQAGIQKAARQLVRDIVHTIPYWRRLGRQLGAPLPFDAVRLAQMDAQSLQYEDDTFDLVVSSAVWEHLPDVCRATREVNRVLKPGGLAAIQMALFPSLAGGHHAEWHSVEPDRHRSIRPWDHLLPGARPLPLYCNGWREREYREVFDEEMDLVDWERGDPVGQAYLAPELRNALTDYTETDLLTPFATAWARKRLLQTARASANGTTVRRVATP